ncbi:MAG: gliding motility-associated C-terminal domain-containing protein [Bacteroidales bacterium]|nr:gliding motility-associated C-terminal domain-containing protein [Bacteroidales bacterium]
MKYIYKKVLLCILGLFIALTSFAQVDTVFWFAVPHITHSHAGRPIKLCISTLGSAATVTVTQPARGNATIATLNVPANSSQSYELVGSSESALSNFECNPNVTSNYGLYIRSTAKVNAYISVQANNSEIYALKGQNAYGTRFFIPMQSQYPNANVYSDARNSVEVIATEDNTSVTITPSVTLYGGSHPANTPFTIILNRGQVYSFASNSQDGNSHLDGSIVVSDKPIVVDISDDSATPNGSNQDLVADQIVPEDLAGEEYIVIPSPSAANNTTGSGLSDYVSIFALENGTDVTIYSSTNASGTPFTATPYENLNRGDKRSYHFTNNNPICVITTKPVFVFQVTGAGNELGGTLLPHVYCTGSTLASYKPEPHVSGHTKHIYLTLICNSAYTNGFQINGSSSYLSASDWMNVPGHTFKYCRKEIASLNTANSIRITNSLGKFHLGVIDYHQNGGGYDDCSISYFSDYSTASSLAWNTNLMHNYYCQGDTLFFEFDTVNVNNLNVTGPNGISVSEAPYYITDIEPSQAGQYTVTGNDARGCLVETFIDSIQVEIHPNSTATAYDTICPGAEYYGYGFHVSADRTGVPGLVTDTMRLQDHQYGCDSLVVLELTVRDSVFTEFTMSACDEYTWNGNHYFNSGDFVQTLTDSHNCDSIVTMHLSIVEPSVEVASTSLDFCEDGVTTLTATTDLPYYQWSTGETTPSIEVTQSGTYTVKASDGDCEATASINVPYCGFNLYLPNTITPTNQDGLNDYFHIPPYIHRYISDFEIYIFDRWGEIVYHSKDINFKWAGENVKIPGIYKYVIKLTNLEGRPFRYDGHITVL